MNTYNYKELNPTAQKTAAYAIREAELPNIEREIGQFISSVHKILGRVTPVSSLSIELARPHSKPHLKYTLAVPKNWNIDDRNIYYVNWYNLKHEEYNDGRISVTPYYTDTFILQRLAEHELDLTGVSVAETIKHAIRLFQEVIVKTLTDEDEMNEIALEFGLVFDEYGHVIPD